VVWFGDDKGHFLNASKLAANVQYSAIMFQPMTAQAEGTGCAT
jgi:hypothetical protein